MNVVQNAFKKVNDLVSEGYDRRKSEVLIEAFTEAKSDSNTFKRYSGYWESELVKAGFEDEEAEKIVGALPEIIKKYDVQ